MAAKRRKARQKKAAKAVLSGQLEIAFPLSTLDADTIQFIRLKACRLAKTPLFSPSDIPDIMQELALDLMVRAARFNRSKGCWRGFVMLVTDNKIARMVEARVSRRRDYRLNQCSINEAVRVNGGEHAERHEILDGQALDPRFRQKQELHDLAIDLAEAIKALPADLQSLCLRLQTHSITEIARDMGVHRDRIYRLISQARAHLIERGLHEYVHRKQTQGENS